MLGFLIVAGAPHSAFASDEQTIARALAKQPFRDLPGVKLQQSTDDEPKTVCTSHIGRDRWDGTYNNRRGYRSGLTRRIYDCDIDTNVTVESSKRPDEVDWKKQKRYYKPWIDDGFDRDR
jgi:hypothetical protein